jgi:VWFA-related protein
MARKLWLGFTGAVLVAALAAAQDDGTVIRGGVELVNVLATVRGKNGALISNLSQSDFRVFEDGKEQQIRYFSRETDLPLTIGMLIDVSGSMGALIPAEQRAAGLFFEKVLRPKDLAFIISFGKDAELLQDLTNSPRLLQKGLDALRLNTRVGGLHPGPVPTAQNLAGTVLYDAVYLAAQERLREETGRKVIILITDGEDTGSQVSREQAIEAAQKADAIIYGIYYNDPRYGGNQGVLKRMAEETGGRVFDVGRRLNLDEIFQQIEEEMRSQYSISYSPANPAKDGSYRRLEIRTTHKDYKVQARKGYYAIPPQQ